MRLCAEIYILEDSPEWQALNVEQFFSTNIPSLKHCFNWALNKEVISFDFILLACTLLYVEEILIAALVVAVAKQQGLAVPTDDLRTFPLAFQPPK